LKKRLLAIEGVDVGSADTNAANAYQRFLGLDRCGRRRPFGGEQGEATGFFKADYFHTNSGFANQL
jgi:hypothetical protein